MLRSKTVNKTAMYGGSGGYSTIFVRPRSPISGGRKDGAMFGGTVANELGYIPSAASGKRLAKGGEGRLGERKESRRIGQSPQSAASGLDEKNLAAAEPASGGKPETVGKRN